MLYAIKKGRLYLQGTAANERYCPTSRAPTMGRRHDHSEYRSIWGSEPKGFERLTALDNLRVVLEEFRWGDLVPKKVILVPLDEVQEGGG